MKRNTQLTIVAIVVTGLIAFLISQWNWVLSSQVWQTAEGLLIDYRYHFRGENPPDTNIIIVGIETTSLTLSNLNEDEVAASSTLQEMRKPYPWDRSVYAATLEKLMGAGAKVVVFDFIFSSPGSKEGDEAFANAIKKYRDHVVLASAFDGDHDYIPPLVDFTGGDERDLVGLAKVWPDMDEIVRRGRYLTSQAREERHLKKFADAYPDDLIQLAALAVKKFTGRVETPPYDHDNFIDFEGVFMPIPIEKLFVPKLWNDPPVNGATHFQNKIVIVGPIANFFHDVHNTPLKAMPGPEVQAHMMATLLNHATLEEPSPLYNRVLTLTMILMAGTICLFASNALTKSALLAGTITGFYGVCLVAFTRTNMVVTMMPPLFGFVSTGVVGVVFQFILEQRERRRVRGFLDRYVSKNVAELVLADQSSFEESLRGKKKPVAILFSDIRGFTTMTEERNPEQLVQQLNEYFEEMVSTIQDENGTVQKFIGDAIMAGWGDTHSRGAQEDARLAVLAGLKMRAGLVKLNTTWKIHANRAQLQTGIGINFGEAIVGDIGTPSRRDFTALGDVVNLAARLETATKQFHTDLLVGESVAALTHEYFVFRKVGFLTVKGKAKAVDAFAVIGERRDGEPAWLSRYHDAIQLFRTREFEKASAAFKAVVAEIQGEDFLCEMYVEWCERYSKAPPPENWNGSFVLTEK